MRYATTSWNREPFTPFVYDERLRINPTGKRVPTISLFSRRFSELAEQAEAVGATKRYQDNEYWSGDYIDDELYTAWKIKTLNLLARSCGEKSVHYQSFEATAPGGQWKTNYETFKKLQAIFNAAMEDYNGGYVASVRGLVQAEVFESELQQARELHAGGYLSAAAVIAGVVLETNLRQMCIDSGLPAGKLDKMNADLVKSGAYNTLVQKRITAIAGVRNSAAHGKPNEFTADDVADMIAYVEKFTSEHV